MKKNIILCFLLCFIFEGTSHADGVILKPSLMAQMKYQENIDRTNAITEKKLKNKMRLAEIRSRKFAEIYKKSMNTNSSQNTPVSNKNVTPWVNPIEHVDMIKVRATWMSWYNEYRTSLGLGSYGYDTRLDSTSHDWNIEFTRGKWENHHRRNPWDSYYDFPVIDAWFSSRGIDPKVINRSKHTENVWYWYYNCNRQDCTDDLIASIRTTWNFFLSEKGKSYDAHYRTIINPYFTKIGMDIITVPGEKRYYLTSHFITE